MEKIICHLTSVHQRYDTRIFKRECETLSKNGYTAYLIVNDSLKNEKKGR